MKIELTGTVTELVCSVDPAAAVNVKMACDMSRGGEKPVTVTVNPVLLRVAVTCVITGAVGLIRSFCVGIGFGVMFCPAALSCDVIVMVPATVPTCTPTVVDVVLPALMVTVAVRVPFENCTLLSSGPVSAANVSVRVTVTSTGYAVASPTPTCGWLEGFGLELAGKPVILVVGVVGSETVSEKFCVVVLPVLSVTVTDTCEVPGAPGVPANDPVGDNVTPVGKPVAAKVYGGTPPVAATVPETADPTVALGSDVVVIVSGGGAIVRPTLLLAVAPVESVTVTDTLTLPAVVGVPLMLPSGVALSPSGNPLTANVYGGTPPEAATLALYPTPTVPFDSDVVETVSCAGVMVIEKLWVAVPPAESVAVTDGLKVPACVGVPPIPPLGERLTPGGNPDPLHVTGGVPPTAVSCAEYPTPTCPLGRVDVVIVSGCVPTCTVNALDACVPVLSTTTTVNVNVPAVV